MSAPAESAHGVVWHEGLFLQPQHFQQLERHRHWHQTTLVQQLLRHAWGISSMAIDRPALIAGRVVLLQADGIMPDGLPFRIGTHEPPLSREVRMPPGVARIGVHLAISAEHPGDAGLSSDGTVDGRPCRWRRIVRQVRDQVSGAARDLELLAPHFRLVLDSEPLENAVSLRIAELSRAVDGGLVLCEEACPPTLLMPGSPPLLTCVRRIEAAVIASAERLASQRRARADGSPECAPADQAALLTLQTLWGSLPGLAALAGAHPAQAHAFIAQLAGMLSALGPARAATSSPHYDHGAPLAGFLELERVIVDALAQSTCTRCTAIALRRLDDRVVVASLPDHALAAARVFIGVSIELPPERVSRELPMKAKLGASTRIEQLITQSLRGVRLSHLALTPPEIAARHGWHYFELAREGDEWKHAVEARSLGIYLPPECAPAALELLVVRS
jgi:type VI secretion system protein ImpJ